MADFKQGFGKHTPKLPKDYNLKDELVNIGLLANSFAPVTGDIQSGLLAANDIKNGDYGSAALNGLGLLPFVPSMAGMIASKGDKVADAIRPLTEFELKQLTAQKNAVEMLGLPPNNTAMDRAKALGFNNNKWHETDVNGFNGITLEGFNPNRAVSAASDEQTPYAVFVKDSAKPVGIKIDNQMQMPLMTREGNSLSFNTRDGLRGYFNQYPDIRTAMDNVKNADKLGAAEIDRIGDEMFSYGRGNVHPNKAELWRQISEITGNNGMVNKLAKVSKEKITTQLKNDNIDSINLFKDEGSMGRAVNTQMILDPKNIRSRFAAFDPARANEADLLGNITPEMAGLLAVGSGAGVGYAYNKKEKKTK